MQDLRMQDQMSPRENAGPEIEGPTIAGPAFSVDPVCGARTPAGRKGGA